MELRTLITTYLQNAKILQIATSSGDQPWACTVYFAFDDDLNLYWLSKPSCRHSEELRTNGKVAGAIVTPQSPGDDVRGLQLQGVAKELVGKDEAQAGLKVYAARFGLDEKRVQAILDGSDGHECYKLTTSLYVLFDETNFPDEPRQEFLKK